jgi:hypothetical protein
MRCVCVLMTHAQREDGWCKVLNQWGDVGYLSAYACVCARDRALTRAARVCAIAVTTSMEIGSLRTTPTTRPYQRQARLYA